MKVLQVINSLDTGGAEKLIVDSVPLYQKQDLEVDVLLLKDKMTPFRKQLSVNSNGKIFAITKKSIYNPFLIFKIIPYLRKYDIVHCHLFPTLYWVAFAKLLSFSNVKIAYTEHSTTNRRRNHFILKAIDRLIYSRLYFVGCISQGVFDNLNQFLKCNKKLKLINNGIELDAFDNILIDHDKRMYFAPSDTVLIQVSSFRKQKDQNTLIEALTFLPANIKLLLVGEGPLKSQREEQVKALGLEARVKFLGNRNDVALLLNFADVVILSSRNEGFGLAIVEGMAAGKPVIASNVTGVREVVKGYGLLFEPGQSKDLADLILRLHNDSAYYNIIREKCLTRARDFDIIHMINMYVSLYKQAV